MPLGSLAVLMLAIFFTFATIGFATDIMSGGQYPAQHLFISIIYSGLIAVAYVLASTRNPWLFTIVIPLHIGFHVIYRPNFEPTPLAAPLENRLFLDAFGIVFLIALGYFFFIFFIGLQGTKSLKLATEMELAQQMHDVLVPDIQFENAELKVLAKSIPATEVGGDLVDLYEVDDSCICYIADISGHGVAASLLMGMFKSAMHTELQQGASLQKTLQEVNRALYRLKKRTMFLTAALMRFSSDKTVEFAVAGHLPILHYGHSTNALSQLSQKQIPLAAQKDYVFNTETVPFEVGDRFILLTDGITETSTKKDVELGFEAVEQVLRNTMMLPLEQQIEAVYEAADAHGSRNDDQTIMIIEVVA